MNIPEGCSWLPGLVLNPGKWEDYLRTLYNFYSQDFIIDPPVFRTQTLRIKRHPKIEGKDRTFCHLIAEGNSEDNRIPDFRRCERIRWPKPIIEHEDDIEIKVWENRRKGETRICLWFETNNYLVILSKRSTYILFWTAYPVKYSHTKEKLKKEYSNYIKRLAPPC